MRRLVVAPLLAALVCFACILAATHPTSARDDGAAAPGEGAEIRRVIEGQLEAFRRDDGEAAFAFASPTIRAMFGDAETFLTMVRASYQPVYRPREVEFRDLRLENGRPTQRILLVGPDGKPVVARYTMERQPDGSWRIAGCVLEQAPDETT